jgi:hypothetical protein
MLCNSAGGDTVEPLSANALLRRERRALATGRVRWPGVELIVTRYAVFESEINAISALVLFFNHKTQKKGLEKSQLMQPSQLQHGHDRVLGRWQQAVAG